MNKSKAKKKAAKPITAEAFDRKAESGEDIADHLDMEKAVWRVPVAFPLWMKAQLDAEAERVGISRTAIINMLVDEGLRRIRERDAKKTG